MKKITKSLALILATALGLSAKDNGYKINIEGNFQKEGVVNEQKSLRQLESKEFDMASDFIEKHKYDVLDTYLNDDFKNLVPLDSQVLVFGKTVHCKDFLGNGEPISYNKSIIIEPSVYDSKDTVFSLGNSTTHSTSDIFYVYNQGVMDVVSLNPSSISSYQEGMAFVNSLFKSEKEVTKEHVQSGLTPISKLSDYEKILIGSVLSRDLDYLYDYEKRKLSSEKSVFTLSNLIKESGTKLKYLDWEKEVKGNEDKLEFLKNDLENEIKSGDTTFIKPIKENIEKYEKIIERLYENEPEMYVTGNICGGNANGVKDFLEEVGMKAYCVSSNAGEPHVSTVAKGSSDSLFWIDASNILMSRGSIEDLVIENQKANHLGMPTRIYGDKGEEISSFRTPFVKNKMASFTGGFLRPTEELEDLFSSKKGEKEINIKLGNIDQKVNLRNNNWFFYVNNKIPEMEDYGFDNILTYGVIKDFNRSKVIKNRLSVFSELDHISGDSKLNNFDELNPNLGKNTPEMSFDDVNMFTAGLHNMVGISFPSISIKDNQNLSFGLANSLYGEAYFGEGSGFGGGDFRVIGESKYDCDGKLNLQAKVGVDLSLSVNGITWKPGIIKDNIYTGVRLDNKNNSEDKKYFALDFNAYFHNGYIESENSFDLSLEKLNIGLDYDASVNTWDIPIVKDKNLLGIRMNHDLPPIKGKKINLGGNFSYDFNNKNKNYSASLNLKL